MVGESGANESHALLTLTEGAGEVLVADDARAAQAECFRDTRRPRGDRIAGRSAPPEARGVPWTSRTGSGRDLLRARRGDEIYVAENPIALPGLVKLIKDGGRA